MKVERTNTSKLHMVVEIPAREFLRILGVPKGYSLYDFDLIHDFEDGNYEGQAIAQFEFSKEGKSRHAKTANR